jgi:hypothetical protein
MHTLHKIKQESYCRAIFEDMPELVASHLPWKLYKLQNVVNMVVQWNLSIKWLSVDSF